MNDPAPKKKHCIIEDPEYGYKRVAPVPTQEDVDRFYTEEFYSSTYKQFNNSSLEVQEKDKVFFDSRWERICDVIRELKGGLAARSVFDIGFGFAQALLYFKERGMDVSGLEPCKEGVDHALSRGLNVHCCGIENFSCVGDQRFDVVTLLNVLEHLRKPYETLDRIKTELLKEDGLLVVSVPNEYNDLQTAANEEYGLNEWWVTPPNHINYFSATSLKRLLKKCGYEVKLCESSFPLEMFLLMGDVYVGDQDIGSKCHKKRVQFETLLRKHGKLSKMYKLYEALADLDLGRTVTVYAQPLKNV